MLLSHFVLDAAESKAITLQQNPLFTSSDLLHGMGCAELVMSCLHPCVREAVEAKDAAVRELYDTTCRLNTAAKVLMLATNMQLPAAVGNAHVCTELAVSASQDALKQVFEASTTVMHRMLQHPPLAGADLRLFKEFVQFMS